MTGPAELDLVELEAVSRSTRQIDDHLQLDILARPARHGSNIVILLAGQVGA